MHYHQERNMYDRDVRKLVSNAAGEGITLWVENGRLHYRATRGDIPGPLRAALQSRKADLIGELDQPVFKKRGSTPHSLRYPQFWLDFWQETSGNLPLANVIHFAVSLTGDISPGRIEAALTTLVSRYDLLCSRVKVEDGAPCLILEQAPTISVVVADDPAMLPRLIQEAIYTPFEDGQLCRARIIEISPSEHVVAMVIHHFVADPVSCTILADELVASLHGRPPRTTERPMQYCDYLLGMNDWLSGAGLKYRMAFWQEHMKGAQPVRFPPAEDPPPAQVIPLDCLEIPIDEDLRTRLTRASATLRAPLAVALLAAKFAALAATLERSDLVIIIVHSGRDDPALLDLVGFTLNCFPVRICVLPEMSYADLFENVNEAYNRARDYQVPWGLLMRSLAQIGVAGIAPIFDYMPAKPEAKAPAGQLREASGLQVRQLPVERPAETTSVDWKAHEFAAIDQGKGMLVTLKYAAAACRAGCVEEFVTAFRLCLEALARDPRQLLNESPCWTK